MSRLLGRLFGNPAASPVIPLEPAPPDTQPDPTSQPSRRARVLGGGPDILVEVIAEKLLHGWLQNRHQTLFPLTVNLRTLNPSGRQTLVDMLAITLLAYDTDDLQARKTATRNWLASVGADQPTLATFDTTCENPPAFNKVLNDVQNLNSTAYAYVAALIASPARDIASTHFLEYLAARLNLPTTVVRSANRRYRL